MCRLTVSGIIIIRTEIIMDSSRFFDIHCHVLPGMDDGCSTEKEAIELLHASQLQGVAGVIATPHYYPQETVACFLQRRQESAERLLAQLEREDGIQIPVCYGAEVAFHTGLVYEKQIEKLCLGKSRYLLLELPFGSWSSSMLREIETLQRIQGVIPVIAHLERYFKIQKKEALEAIWNADVLIQMNAEYILGGFREWHIARKMLKSGRVDVLGSDSHNLVNRQPNLGSAVKRLEKQAMHRELSHLYKISQQIFSAANGELENE